MYRAVQEGEIQARELARTTLQDTWRGLLASFSADFEGANGVADLWAVSAFVSVFRSYSIEPFACAMTHHNLMMVVLDDCCRFSHMYADNQDLPMSVVSNFQLASGRSVVTLSTTAVFSQFCSSCVPVYLYSVSLF